MFFKKMNYTLNGVSNMYHVLHKSHRNKYLVLIKLNPWLKDIIQVNAITLEKNHI